MTLHQRCRLWPLACILLSSGAPSHAQTVWTLDQRNRLPDIVSTGISGGSFRMEIAAPPGTYPVEKSSTLAHGSWSPAGAIQPQLGTGVLADPLPTVPTRAFYRVAGTFDETAMGALGFRSAVSSGGVDGFPTYGGLWTGHNLENWKFQSAAPTTGLLHAGDGHTAKFRVEPLNAAPVSAFIERWNDVEVIGVTINATSWLLDTAEGPLTALKLEGGNHSLVAVHTDSLAGTDETPWGTYRVEEEAFETLWAIAKSTNARTADLAGNWGFIRILADGLGSDMVYNGEAWTTTFAGGANPLTFAVGGYTEFDVKQDFLGGLDFGFGSYVHSPPVNVSLNLAANGSVVVQPLQPAGEAAFQGMASPSGKLIVAASSTPGIGALPGSSDEIFISDLDKGASQWLIGVKRTNTPQLAGKTFRVIHTGWWIGAGGFEVHASGATDRLVFNASGTSVTRTFEANFGAVDFGGLLEAGLDLATLSLSVSVNAEGLIQFAGSVPGDVDSFKSFGFMQEGNGLLVLIDAITDIDDAGLGLMIAVQEP